MKDLFVGALGRVNNHGGSRIYTTPNTVKVEPEYYINVSYNIQGDLIAHSLDGRLWLYRRNRRLGVIALRWSKENSKLEYAAAKNFSNNDDVVLVRGLDWVLTNNNIFMVSDEAPYILNAPLFASDVPDTYLYSFLRAKGVGASGIDPFTNEAWGKREDNGNSEGTGYFSKSTHLLYPAGTHSMEHCYSLLPAVGDWQIVENFLVRRPDAESLDSYNYMQSMRPLIPLELRYGSEPLYGTGYNFDHRGIQLACVNGQLWGRGARNIGKVYILPAVFAEDGSVQEYYLYISPDYVCENVDDWLNIGLLNSSHGFLSQQESPITGGLCEKAQNTSLFDPQTKQWDNLSENNGSLFVDVVSSRGLVLDETGMKILKEGEIETFTCATLPQWVAPVGKVEAIDDDSVVASVDNAVLHTSLITGFNRELITPNTLPLSGTTFTGSSRQKFRVAVHEDSSGTRKAFTVNRLAAKNAGVQNIPWENVYKNAVSIEKVCEGSCAFKYRIPIYDDEGNFLSNSQFFVETYPVCICVSSELSRLSAENITSWTTYYGTTYDGDFSEFGESIYPWVRKYDTYEINYNFYISGPVISISADCFYINPDNGQKIKFTVTHNAGVGDVVTKSASSMVQTGNLFIIYFEYQVPSIGTNMRDIQIRNGKLGFMARRVVLRDVYSFNDHDTDWQAVGNSYFVPVMDVPIISSFWTEYSDNTNGMKFGGTIKAYNEAARFIEPKTNIPFYFLFSLPHTRIQLSLSYAHGETYSTFILILYTGEYIDIETRAGELRVTLYRFIVFRSQIHTDIFDFDAELERSKLS